MVADTGIFIEHLRAKDKSKTTLYNISATKRNFISSITLYELYMGATTKEKQQDIENITESFIVLPFTDITAHKSAEIYHQLRLSNQMIEFRDIFIAATCVVNELPIVTLNKKHFKRINGLEIENVAS